MSPLCSPLTQAHPHEALIIAAAPATLGPPTSGADPLAPLRRLARIAPAASVVEVPEGRGKLALAVRWVQPADLAPLVAALNASSLAKLDVDLLTDLAPDRGTHAPALSFLLSGLSTPLQRLTLHDATAPSAASLAAFLARSGTLQSLTLAHYPITVDSIAPLLDALRSAPAHALATMRLGHRRLPPPVIRGGCFLPPAVRPDPAAKPLAEIAALLEARGKEHERVRAAVRRALVPARVLLRASGEGAVMSLPPELLVHVVRFTTRDPGALSAAQLARLCTIAAARAEPVDAAGFGAAMDAAVAGAFRSERVLEAPAKRPLPGVCPFVPVVKCGNAPALVEWGR
ncbi:uncharacterized protein LOC62_04G005385 [Vanrija pseudolonga]|uniref:Uncharacterized protein n=1 Tax=Vanrija pseudolonga TaxID=143232 RepID=A0AAF1BMB5_9TREE|nr:hypothetical protein LOC62_04G005385 [Vanrija pseudolonga]